MERLTEKCWMNLDPWECCGQDSHCTRNCHEEGGCANGCKVPKMYVKLAKYEDAEEQGSTFVERIAHDVGYVLIDLMSGLYYCGMNTWSDQLRKAQIYHSSKHIVAAAEDMCSPRRRNTVPIDMDKAILKVLKVEIAATSVADINISNPKQGKE